MKRLLFVDTETGGLKPKEHDLLTIGLVVYEEGKSLFETEILIKKDSYNVCKEAMDVNKIDLEDLKKNGMTEKEAVLEINRICKEYFLGEKPILVGHNISFDAGFLKELYFRTYTKYYDTFSYRAIDTMAVLLYLYYAGKIEKYIGKLDDAIEYFNLELDTTKRHSALTDCKVTVDLFNKTTDL